MFVESGRSVCSNKFFEFGGQSWNDLRDDTPKSKLWKATMPPFHGTDTQPFLKFALALFTPKFRVPIHHFFIYTFASPNPRTAK